VALRERADDLTSDLTEEAQAEAVLELFIWLLRNELVEAKSVLGRLFFFMAGAWVAFMA
jgi:hypothetical protein